MGNGEWGRGKGEGGRGKGAFGDKMSISSVNIFLIEV